MTRALLKFREEQKDLERDLNYVMGAFSSYKRGTLGETKWEQDDGTRVCLTNSVL